MTNAEIGVLAARLANSGVARAVGSDLVTIAGDAAIPVTKDATYLITKGSAAALSLAAPGADNVGRCITFIAGSNFAHVLTTAAALANGTAVKSTWTSAAFVGSSLTLRAISATLWACVSNQLGTYA